MKECRRCKEVKAESEFYKHTRSKDRLTYECKTCILALRKQQRLANPEAHRARCRQYYAENRDKLLADKADYYQDNRDEILAKHREWHHANSEHVSERAKIWRVNNPDKLKANYEARYARSKHVFVEGKARRRAKVKQASPAWSNAEIVRSFYKAVEILNSHDGPVKYSVDHIVPLTNKLVSGLHAHTNLTIVPLPENISKNNRHWPDMP